MHYPFFICVVADGVELDKENMVELDKENIVGIENNDWLHRDD
jgi:hypothetical protein